MAATSMPYPCPDKRLLQMRWADAITAYAELVKSLLDQTRQLPKKQHEKLLKEVDAARMLTKKLKRDLDMHTKRHGC